MPGYIAEFEWTCPHCGRYWDALGRDGIGHRAGFVKKAKSTHIAYCGRRTPAQRRACNRTAEAAWKRRPPDSIVTNNPNHPGLKD